MEVIRLVRPGKEHQAMVTDYISEHALNLEYDIHGGALVEKLDYDVWLKQLADNSDKSTVNKDWVVSSTFLGIRESDNRMVGIIDIRHELNDFLREYGGHIGLGIRPSERRKSYAAQMLEKALTYCKELGLEKVMTACYKDNVASRNTILKNGGVLEKEFNFSEAMPEVKEQVSEHSKEDDAYKKIVQVFWVTL